MTPDEFITAAIERGQVSGAASLDADERLVFLISEAEVCCDMDGIDSLLDKYVSADLVDCVAAFFEVGASDIAKALGRIVEGLPARPEPALGVVDALIKDRVGYDYGAIRTAIARRLAARIQAREHGL
jgi:hypothetical protein